MEAGRRGGEEEGRNRGGEVGRRGGWEEVRRGGGEEGRIGVECCPLPTYIMLCVLVVSEHFYCGQFYVSYSIVNLISKTLHTN